MNTNRTAYLAALLFSLSALAGCAATNDRTVEDCPLLGVATGAPDCYVDYYGAGNGGPGDSDSEGDSEGEE